ncbi:hypothetical protein JW897_04940 [Chromobacterium alkanivorans]|uniref:ABC-three component system protein n=1 Tax=Chromobacterium alkanivorans TaxID=1071719 RepID=UPI001966FAAA|nr:ABC-three component system protein [Chromobacterium alkanivorans]MBN3003078.1 hypothetical protein [Chromobacterium alkanivorans]
MSTKSEDVKPMVHDATPSWNGFNYQGKVGLYVCLCIIKENCETHNFSREDLYSFLNDYQIEYEWIEDFSIKYKENYVSIHQVKHYKGSDFSSYKDAIETIISRKRGIISTADVRPYLKRLPEGKSEEVIAGFMKELFDKGLIDKNHIMPNDWQGKISSLEYNLQGVAKDFLLKINNLHKNAYRVDVPVYLHSCSAISKPKLALEEYKWTLESTGESLKKNNLNDFGIIIHDFDGNKFPLALDDEELTKGIKALIENVRLKICPSSQGMQSSESMDCYMSAMLFEIDQHIVDRHKMFGENKSGANVLNSSSLLRLSVFTKILETDYQVQDEDYFALRAKLMLEKIIDDYTKRLGAIILRKKEKGADFNIDLARMERIENFRLNVISSMPPRELLTNLERSSPNKKKISPYDLYFPRIIQEHGINNVLLRFIELLEEWPSNFFATSQEGDRYAPSCIDASSEDFDAEDAHYIIAKDIVDACDSNAYVDALLYDFNYIAIKAKDDCELPCAIIPPKFDDLEKDKNDDAPVFHEKKKTQLISYKFAAKKVNGESC